MLVTEVINPSTISGLEYTQNSEIYPFIWTLVNGGILKIRTPPLDIT